MLIYTVLKSILILMNPLSTFRKLNPVEDTDRLFLAFIIF